MQKAAFNKYKEFHGKRPREILQTNIRKFNTVVCLGDALFIAYASDKRNGGGTGRREYFKHKFNKNTKLCCTPDGRTLIIMGTRLNTNNRGIVG